MKYKLIIFDWDGTLVDSTGRIVDSMQQASVEVGLPAVPDMAVQNIIGLGLPEALQTVWPGIDASQMSEMTRVYARHFVYDSKVAMAFFDGVADLLGDLRQAGCKLAVATGKSRKGLDRMLTQMEVDGRPVGEQFAASRCADETRSKPDPLMLKELLDELNIPAEEALMIGDTSFDLNMASALNIDSVAMSHGAHDRSVLLDCQPRAMCHSITELNQWIKQNG
ncbi:MAG: HAD-IA family hydrolase [Saccharospirillaceae bacterium]|nr:HAD-IA family hydrolase [Saccharospirillaceae bacterium]